MQGERFSGANAFKTTWTSATMHAMVSLNNLKWDEPSRRTNIFVYVGGGGTRFSSDFKEDSGGGSKDVDNAMSPVLDIGLGISIRLNKHINVGIDHKFSTLFSKYADRIDGFENQGFRDMANYTSVRLNFNIGKKDLSEPLYWVNPLQTFIDDISNLKAKSNDFIPIDTDGDGVLDILDLEPDTPFGAPVDTRGITLDSDSDGIPNYKDLEPFSPPNFTYDDKGVAIKPLEQDTISLVNQAIRLFLPIIHFKTNQSDIRETEHSKLEHIGRTMLLYKDIRLLVIGYADIIGSEQYNNEISYQRAAATIDYLTNRYSISRERFVLSWKGEKDAVVVDDEDSYMNRRVEFQEATPEMKDMESPKGKEKKGF
jgi:outer membrane protein OmpA-like peptidoglycan-associated protein